LGVDFARTDRFEEKGVSLDRREGGYEIEPFNLSAERESGHFDDDFNFVQHGRDTESGQGDGKATKVRVRDAWLDSMDELKESDEKVLKRRRAAEEQARRQAAVDQDWAQTDIPALKSACAQLLHPGETVLQGLRRLGGGGPRAKRPRGQEGRTPKSQGQRSSADPEAHAAFNRLTEAASTLLDAGEVSIYSETRESLDRGAGVNGSSAVAAAPAASDYVIDPQTGIYYNQVTGFCFDPSSQLHWDPRLEKPVYYIFNAETGAYVEASASPAAAAPGTA